MKRRIAGFIDVVQKPPGTEMQFNNFELDGPFEIKPHKIEDKRGYFSEVFRMSSFVERVPGAQFVQDNQSLSIRAGTIRGIHFQTHPAAQGKLVRCVAGSLWDVAVDLRSDSSTYGHWISTILSPQHNNQLWVPVGFGHGFCTLEPNSVIAYRVTHYYDPRHDKGLAWDDSDVGIDWPEIADPKTLSEKDRRNAALIDLPPYFSMKVS